MREASHPYSPLGTVSPGSVRALAFSWGLAESTFFFLVPDVLLTRLALTDFRRALVGCAYALAGALLGGTALWFAARNGGTQFLLNAFDWVPGISRVQIVRTAQALDAQGLLAMATGALAGQPYKLFAVHSGAQDISLGAFLAVSAVARLARFTLTASIAWLAGRMLRHLSDASKLRLHFYFWLIFYSCYFVLMRT
jgi:membrane protein YqaA with SNARE-associated domain